MKHLRFKAVIACLALLSCYNATAAPMGFDESYMVMGDFTNNWQELTANYATTPRDAFGVTAIYMRSDDKTKLRSLEEFTYTRLLKRWNAPHSQTNFWFFGGVGALQGQDKRAGRDRHFNKVMVSPGIQFDHETARVYFSAAHRFFRASDINHDFTAVRAGFSFYETDYDQIQPWFILEARNMNGLSEKVEITPMLRFIHSSIFVEAGVNNFHKPRFNFMYIF
ncbi:MAG: hypothetical protein ACKE5M_03410 [Methylophilaceae bacterium]